MPKFLIDVNLPYYFSLWNSEEYIHQIDIEPKAKDNDIWNYARESNLIIISKDRDFSGRILISYPPPKIILIRVSNKSTKDFHQVIELLINPTGEISGFSGINRF